jgi:hypothetical protein
MRRETLSIYPELRAMSWAGAIFIATGVAMLLAKNYERIGPLAIATAVGMVAAGAYGYAIWRRRAGGTSLVDDYILLLGALLLSADLAFIEGQFHLLDHGWPRHLLVLAVVHGLTAYYFDSGMLLSLSITALAGWVGVEQRVDAIFQSTTETGIRAMVSSGLVLVWMAADRRRTSTNFQPVFAHFAANLALLGGLILVFEDDGRAIGTLLTVVFALAVARYGFAARSESFVLYAYAYAFLAVLIFIADLIGNDTLIALFVLIASVTAIAGLFILHLELKKRMA